MSTDPARQRRRRVQAAPDARDLAPWAQSGISWAGGLLAFASVIAGSISLGRLAYDAGYHDPRCVLFALGFDFAAAVTGLAWAGGRPRSYWFYFGRRATLALTGTSLLFQGAEVLQTMTNEATGKPLLPPEWLLVVALCVAGLFPLMSVLFGHLVMTVRGAAAAERARVAAEQAAAEQAAADKAAADKAAAARLAEQAAADKAAAELAAVRAAEQRTALVRTLALLPAISPRPAAVAPAAGDVVPPTAPRVPVRSLPAGPDVTSPASGPAGDTPAKPIGGTAAAQKRLVARTVRLLEKARRDGQADPGIRPVAAELSVSKTVAGRLLEFARAELDAAAEAEALAAAGLPAATGTNGHAYLAPAGE